MFSRPAKTRIIWEPQPDITTYELAMAIKVIIASTEQFADVRATYDTLPNEVQRHFKVWAEVA